MALLSHFPLTIISLPSTDSAGTLIHFPLMLISTLVFVVCPSIQVATDEDITWFSIRKLSRLFIHCGQYVSDFCAREARSALPQRTTLAEKQLPSGPKRHIDASPRRRSQTP